MSSETKDENTPKLPKLTRRNQRFADEYLTGVSGAEAMRRIGSKGTPQRLTDRAYRMLRRPEVSAYIAERRKNLSEATGIRAEQIARELSLIAFGNLKSLFDADGNLTKIADLTEDQAAMLASVEVEKLFEGRGESRVMIGDVIKIKAWNKVEALRDLAKLLGHLTEKVEHSGEIKTGGVLVVPATPSESDWEKSAQQQQSDLADKERAFNVNAKPS